MPEQTDKKVSFTVKYSCLCGTIGRISTRCSNPDCEELLTEDTTSKVRVCNGCGHIYDFDELTKGHECPPPEQE